ncbi:MAG TPA: hypothetical protein PLP50_10055 [Thermoanaerobaculia bacterium]|nr:hypothetical protein [Thermoanaerobaculia bacterium]HPA51930.1 hypothetical protein [Thermoanaerobaculia bacterium]HQN06830.1 hypothetical protein [Thermoanaerobaculia bacterium]HQP86669.1 hypothetical protein [Thermoanaerobaculia bacterium]
MNEGPGPSGERLRAAFDAVHDLLESRYGIPVRIADVLDPNTGDFDGVEIAVDHDQEVDVALFVLAHLFGHTVQWNVSEELRELGIAASSLDASPGPERLEAIRRYEREASEYALALFHEAGVEDLDAWLSDWAEADWRYLSAAYAGKALPGEFRAHLRPGAALLVPRSIPPFQPTRWVSRYSF